MINTKIKKWFVLSSIFFMLVLFFVSFIFINKYLSGIVISGPFTVSIDGTSLAQSKAIKIYGYSPFNNTRQGLMRNEKNNSWEFSEYRCFKNLFIFFPDNVSDIGRVRINKGKNQMVFEQLPEIQKAKIVELTPQLKGFTSKQDILISVLQLKEIKQLLFLVIIVLLCFTIVFIILRRKKATPPKKVILWGIILVCIVIHASFYFLTGFYLISSGLCLYIILSLIVYILILFFLRIFKKAEKKIREIQLTIITITICLCLVELVLILIGFKTTFLESKNKFYYASPYSEDKDNDWFHIWSNEHDLKTNEYTFHRTINSENLSDKEHPVDKNVNEFRIIGLGDSFTEGDGADADSTWLKFLERSLSKYPIKKQLTYINAGVCGSDPFFEFVLLKERLLKYKPDVVLLAVNNSDIYDILIRGGMERFRPDGTIKYNNAPWWEPIYACSRIARLFFHALGYNKLFVKNNDCRLIKSKEKIIETLELFKILAKENKFDLIIIFHPDKTDVLLKQLKLNDVYQKLFCEKQLSIFNMLDYFATHEKIDSSNYAQYYWVKDGHHNAKGYAAFARGVEWKLKEMGIMDSLMIK